MLFCFVLLIESGIKTKNNQINFLKITENLQFETVSYVSQEPKEGGGHF